MPISEQDISILIPTYRYRDKVGRAVESALASGASEIIVTDDHSRDGTMELLERYEDPRLKVIENPKNLGLWENHLAALGYATRPWIKFIQADDYLLPGGLAAYATAVESGVTVVWGCPVVKDDETDEIMHYHKIKQARRLTGLEVLDVCLKAGWLLGSPSHMMLRLDSIERDPSAWTTDISSDLVIGSIAAAHGDVVLLPSGAIGQGAHPWQDAKTQGIRRGLCRIVGSAAYLRARPEPTLQRFATLWAALNQRVAQRTALSGVLRRQIAPREAIRLVLGYRSLARVGRRTREDRVLLRAARAFRRSNRNPLNIDHILATLRAV